VDGSDDDQEGDGEDEAVEDYDEDEVNTSTIPASHSIQHMLNGHEKLKLN